MEMPVTRNLDQYVMMHQRGFFPGNSTEKWSDEIKDLLTQHEVESVLDYGSGKGKQYSELKLHERWGIEMPVLYDPAWPPISEFPRGKFDAVVCTDVMEHLEGDELFAAIRNIYELATKCAFVSVTCRPAGKTLPDGRNCHISIHPPWWWRGYFQAVRDAGGGYGGLDVRVRFEE